MHRRAHRSKSASDYDSKSISRASIENREKIHVCDYSSQSTREVVARTVANRRFVRPDHLWSFRGSDQAKADPGPLQPGMCGLHEPAVRSSRDRPNADEF